MVANKVALLKQFTLEELKEEVKRRKTLELARKFLPNAEESLRKAEEKVKRYRQAIKEYGTAGKP